MNSYIESLCITSDVTVSEYIALAGITEERISNFTKVKYQTLPSWVYRDVLESKTPFPASGPKKTMEITGKITQLMVAEAGLSSQNKPWKKQEFIVETMETYPKKMAFEAWNDDVKLLNDIPVGAIVKVAFNLESKEYNGRWYTTMKAWKITPLTK